MSTASDALALEKAALLNRSALCRLRLRREASGVRNSLSWRHVALAAGNSRTLGRIGFGIALSLVGLGRSARLLLLAGRIILIARTAQAALGLIAHAVSPAESGERHVRDRTDTGTGRG